MSRCPFHTRENTTEVVPIVQILEVFPDIGILSCRVVVENQQVVEAGLMFGNPLQEGYISTAVPGILIRPNRSVFGEAS